MNVASTLTTKIASSWARRQEGRQRRHALYEAVLTETKAVWRYYERGPWKAWEPTGPAMTLAMTRADQAGFKLVRLVPSLNGTVAAILACSDAMLQERMAGGRRVSADLVGEHRSATKALVEAVRASR